MKKFKIVCFPCRLVPWYLGSADSNSTLRVLNFWHSFSRKFKSTKWKLFILLENWHNQYLEDDHFYSNFIFLNFQPWIYFRPNLSQKSQSCLFCLKMDTQSMVRMLIFIPTLVVSMSNHKSIVRQIWSKIVKIVMLWFYFPSIAYTTSIWSTVYLILYLCFVSL